MIGVFGVKPMIRVLGVTQHYSVRRVLRHVDLEIEEGEMVTILGPNGMGKTTLLGVMAGVIQPQQGGVEINGLMRYASADNELAIRKLVYYLPDHPWLPKNRTGREFLFGVGHIYGRDDERLLDHVERLLRLFELAREGDWPIRSYSNGQKKKMAICAALVSEAPILFLDEPFSGGLDPSGIFALKRVLQRLTERNAATIIMTTPVPEVVEELAHRIVVLRDGQVAAFDTVEGLRRKAQCAGPLSEALQKLLHPESFDNVAHYFDETRR
ncbi:MAG TPA: ABC transporter ATP-binding protein [Pirellulales bacterium]|nr:ABC transporter ATP-binding protein [Pirellulales bacterium]